MFCDFVIKHDWDTETPEDLAYKIFYSIFIGRIKENKPCVIFIGGGSGEGKSISGAIKLQEVLLRLQGITDIKKGFNAMNVYTPLQFPQKMNTILFDKEYKDYNVFAIHESRELVKAKSWQNFLTQAVADINATSRQVKRVISIFVSQSLSDITKDVRKTLNFLIQMRRPRGKRPRMKIKVLWLDERDPEKPQLRTRYLSGLLIDKHGRYSQFSPTYFEISPPDKELIEIFEKEDKEAKISIIKKKMDKLMEMMGKEMGVNDSKVDLLAEHYTKDLSSLMLIGKQKKDGWRIGKDIQKLHNLNDEDFKVFELKINSKVRDKFKVAITESIEAVEE